MSFLRLLKILSISHLNHNMNKYMYVHIFKIIFNIYILDFSVLGVSNLEIKGLECK